MQNITFRNKQKSHQAGVALVANLYYCVGADFDNVSNYPSIVLICQEVRQNVPLLQRQGTFFPTQLNRNQFSLSAMVIGMTSILKTLLGCVYSSRRATICKANWLLTSDNNINIRAQGQETSKLLLHEYLLYLAGKELNNVWRI